MPQLIDLTNWRAPSHLRKDPELEARLAVVNDAYVLVALHEKPMWARFLPDVFAAGRLHGVACLPTAHVERDKKEWCECVGNLLVEMARAALIPKAELFRSETWPEVQMGLDQLENAALSAIRELPLPEAGLHPRELDQAARALALTRLELEAAWRPRALPATGLRWRLEGPFDSSYSLASVNRETARALSDQGVDLQLVSAEGPGPFDPDPDFLEAHPDLAALHAKESTPESAHVLSRNMFPPRVSDMRAPLNLLHGFAWEETGLPLSFSRDMTRHLQGALVTSEHVKRVFEDAGLGLPVHVVGNGVDHLDVEPEPLPFDLPRAAFTCLHVSSCFPRKGPDVLLAGFAEAFADSPDVQLLIKTFPNPHNDIAAQVAALPAGTPPITVIEEELTPGQMRSLYGAADLLVMPSRAEGYCLPVAEAILAGTPVLTTGWGGQRVFAGNPLVTFLDYEFAPAESHLGAWDSVWAEPDRQDFVAKLRAASEALPPASELQVEARDQLLAEHRWSHVGQCSESAARAIARATPKLPPKIGWVSSYNTRCGIATYSAHLIGAIPDAVTVFASETQDRVTPDGPEVHRVWQQDGQDDLTQLRARIKAVAPQVVVIQFNYGFFSFPHLAWLLVELKAAGHKVVVMLHSTEDRHMPRHRQLFEIRGALAKADRLLVHSHHDLNRLKAMGLEETAALFPHGVPVTDAPDLPPPGHARDVVLGSFGFFLPQKGLDKLISAVGLMRGQGIGVALNMVNAEFPVIDSIQAIAAARAQITDLDLEGKVTLETGFLTDADSFARLACSDALIFPYQATAESASGAIRQALALDRPVVVTPNVIFDDVAPLVTRLPGFSAEEIAQGLAPMVEDLRAGGGTLAPPQERARAWRQSHAYPVLGSRLWRLLKTL